MRLGKNAARLALSVQTHPAAWWAVTRLLTVVLLLGYEANAGVFGDVNYFDDAFGRVLRDGFSGALPEYPLPMVGVSFLVWGVTAPLGGVTAYALAVVVMGLVVDGLFTRTLLVQQVGDLAWGALVWMLAVPVLGGLSLVRFDLVVGVLVAVAILELSRGTLLPTALVSVATALKLWPVLLLPVFVAAGRRGRALVTIAVVGASACLVTVLLGGWDRLFSPLTYQGDRGLQVESILATPLMLAWAVSRGHWTVTYADSRSFEISGPGTGPLLLMTSILTLALLAGWAVLVVRLLRMRHPVELPATIWWALACTCGFLVSSKVLSPQYLLWVLPVAAAGVTVAPSRLLRRWTGWLLATAALSHLVYPVLYRGLVLHVSTAPVAVAALTARNVLLLGLFVVAAREMWRATRACELDLDAVPGERPSHRPSA